MKVLLVLIFTAMLSGCVAIVAGGAAVSAVTVGEDPRSLGVQLDDTTRASNIRLALADVPAIDDEANIDVHIFNGVALLHGQAPNANIKAEAERVVKSVSNVTKVHNQVRIASPTASSTRAHDIWLASKLRSIMLADGSVNALKLDVVVEDSEVFLMGIVTQQQAQNAIDVARNIKGVVKVFNVMEITG